MNESIISRAFEDKRQEIQNDVNNIYAEIAKIIKSKPIERVTKEITIAEASRLNTYCQNLEQSLRKTACDKMIDAGVPENEVNIIWARAKRKVGAPQTELCKEEEQNIPCQGVQKSHGEKKPEKQESAKCAASAVLISGAAVEVIGWVFIPGMGKFAAVVKGIGLVIMAAGVYMTYEESKEKPRIKVSDEFGEQNVSKTEQIIDSICENQCRLNTSILCTWLQNVCDAVLQECKAQSGQ